MYRKFEVEDKVVRRFMTWNKIKPTGTSEIKNKIKRRACIPIEQSFLWFHYKGS